MPNNRIASILKVAAWPVVVLILAILFMLLFRSSLDQFITKWESLKFGGVEVQVKNEQEKAFLETVLAERDALIDGMRQNVDSMKLIIKDLEIENEILVSKLKETSKNLPSKDRTKVKEVVDHSEETVQASRMQTKSIEQTVEKNYQSLQLISSNEGFQAAAAETNKGFELLLKDEVDDAVEAFKTSEAKYPSIKRAEQTLSEFVQQHKKLLLSGDKKKKQLVFSGLLENFSEKMSEKIKKQVKVQAKSTQP